MVSHEIQDYGRYIDQWREDNLQALKVPLTECDVLRPTRASRFDYPLIFGSTLFNNTQSPSQAAELAFTSNGRAKLLSPEQMAQRGLILLQPLATGPDKWAQVWLAQLQPIGADVVDFPIVVVKLFQESLFPILDWVDWRNDTYWTACLLSHRESWAYRALRDLQGRIIPHSYGFFDFSLPCGQLVCGHVLEFVKGPTLTRDWDSMRNGSWWTPEAKAARGAQMDRFMSCVHQLHLHGVVHYDLGPKNIIVPDADPNSFVFIDFGTAESLIDPASRIAGQVVDDARGIWMSIQELEECEAAVDWLMEHRHTAPWGGMFHRYGRILENWWPNAESAEKTKREEAGITDSILPPTNKSYEFNPALEALLAELYDN